MQARLYLTVFCLLLTGLCITARAQRRVVEQPAAGMRQGVAFWMTKTGAGEGSLSKGPAQRFTAIRELYFRTGLSESWSGEAGLQHFALDMRSGLRQAPVTQRYTFLQLNLSAQYDITSPLPGYMVPFLRRLRSYAGFTISPSMAFAPGERSFSLLTGVSYTHLLPLGRRAGLSSVFSFRSIPFGQFRKSAVELGNPNRALSWSGGLCYRL